MSDEIVDRIERPRAETGPLIGHEAACRTLAEAWSSSRMAHAWLFAGPPGIGKATLAWRFVRYIVAGSAAVGGGAGLLDTPPDHPDGRKVIAGAHPDCRLVRRSQAERPPHRLRTEIAVGDIRAATQFLNHTAAYGAWRCLVVDAADEMNVNAQNALLKLLEEPPPRTVILLVTHAPSRLLPTIRSRCRTLVLRALSEEQTATVLARQCPELPPEDARLLARLAEGAPGRAVDLAREGGIEVYRELRGLLATLPDLDRARLHATADKLSGPAGEAAYRTYMQLLKWWLNHFVRAAATGRDDPLVGDLAAAGAGPARGEAAAQRGLEPWLKAWENIDELTGRADSVNLDRKQVVLNTFFELSAAARG